MPVFMPAATPLELSVAGSALTVNGIALDFSPLTEGDVLPIGATPDFIVSDVKNQGGALHLSLLLPLGPDASHVARFPQPITITKNGPVELPK